VTNRSECLQERDPFDVSRLTAGVALSALFLFGVFLRIYRLNAFPFWNDECLQLNGIMMPLKQLRPNHLFGIEHMPPLSFWIQRMFWLPFRTLYAARFPGAVAGALMIPVAYVSVRRILTRFAGLCAALLTAASLYLVYYSQECRTYIFFGLAIWLFLGLWLDIMFGGSNRDAAWWKWALFALFGFLCGTLHFAALVFLPTLGLLSSGILLFDWFLGGANQNFKPIFKKWIGLFATLILAWGLIYLLMRYSMGPKLKGMMEGTRDEWTPPATSFLYDVFLSFSWGKGWRLILLLFAILPAWVAGDAKVRKVATSVMLLFVVSFLLSFYFFPLLGFRSTTGAFRYLFWCSWPLVILPALGVCALVTAVSRRLALPTIATALLLYAACQTPIFSLYHSMSAKRNNLNELKKGIESIPGERLFVLCNSYDMHFMQFSRPTNCTFASAPGFNTEVDYARLGIAGWIEGVSTAFPDAVLKEGHNIHPLIRATFTNLAPSYGQCLVVSNNVSDEKLYNLGLSPMLGKPMTVVWNSEADLERFASEEQRDWIRFPPSMPLVTTRDNSGGFDLWRVLDRPRELLIMSSSRTNSVSVALRIPQFAQRAEMLVETADGKRQKLSLPAVETPLFDFGARSWVSRPLSISHAARLSGRVPMKLNSKVINIRVPAGKGRVMVRLTPIGSAVLVAAVDAPAL